ncbi:MAG: serine hydrolase [Burkholderiaceae bacterium]
MSVVAISCSTAFSQTPPKLPDPVATDPVTMGWMQGIPPAPDKTLRFADGSFIKYPGTRWTFSHARELAPTSNVWHGSAAPHPLQKALRNLDQLTFADDHGAQISWQEMLTRTYTDSVLVLYKGRIVYEKYMGVAQPQLPHSVFSVTKSMVGTLAAMLAHEGKLDPTALVTKYIPELKDSAYGDATVQQLMDMTVGVHYSETYSDPKAEIWDYARAGGMIPAAPGYAGPKTFYDFLQTLKKEGEHGAAFSYKTVNAEALAWVVQRVAGKPLPTLFSERIWQKLGAENDAFFTVDSVGIASGGGGLSMSLRDMARFGEMMRLDGKYNGQQIIPRAVVENIRNGGDPTLFAKAGYPDVPGYGHGYSYHDMWWISNNPHRVFDARGIFGQRIYIDPKAEMVIVKLSSHPIAGNIANIPLTDRGFAAVADYLMAK